MSAFHLTSIRPLCRLKPAYKINHACTRRSARTRKLGRVISVAALPRSLALPVAGSFGIRPSKIRYQARPMPARTSATSFFRISNLS
jgi:hypothetical protein